MRTQKQKSMVFDLELQIENLETMLKIQNAHKEKILERLSEVKEKLTKIKSKDYSCEP